MSILNWVTQIYGIQDVIAKGRKIYFGKGRYKLSEFRHCLTALSTVIFCVTFTFFSYDTSKTIFSGGGPNIGIALHWFVGNFRLARFVFVLYKFESL